MTHCSSRSQISCSLNCALLALGRDNALRRSYLRRRWQSCHPPSDTYRTASGKMPRQKKTAIERSAIHTDASWRSAFVGRESGSPPRPSHPSTRWPERT